MNPRDPFREKPNYDEAAAWFAIKDVRGKGWWLTAADYARLTGTEAPTQPKAVQLGGRK